MSTNSLTDYIQYNRIANIKDALEYSVFCGTTGIEKVME